jgi:hypothetical protein
MARDIFTKEVIFGSIFSGNEIGPMNITIKPPPTKIKIHIENMKA